MITTVFTITELSFRYGDEVTKKLLRFRDKGIRDKYLKNVTLRHYKSNVESGNYKPETYDVPVMSDTSVRFGFEAADGKWYYTVKAGVEEIEIIEALSSDEEQLKLEL